MPRRNKNSCDLSYDNSGFLGAPHTGGWSLQSSHSAHIVWPVLRSSSLESDVADESVGVAVIRHPSVVETRYGIITA